MFSSRREGASAVEKDYLIRQLKQLLEKLMKKTFQKGQPAAVSQEDLRTICTELLNVEYDEVLRLNVASMAMLLRSPERIEAFALLMETEAEQMRAAGDVGAADGMETRVHELRARGSRAEEH